MRRAARRWKWRQRALTAERASTAQGRCSCQGKAKRFLGTIRFHKGGIGPRVTNIGAIMRGRLGPPGGGMPEQKPVVQKMKAAEVGQDFEQLLKRVSQGEIRVVVDEDGTTLGALISAE